MAAVELPNIYRDYIACLNWQNWPNLGQFVDEAVIHNGRRLGLSGYIAMLQRDFDEIPDLHFNVELLVTDPPYVTSRLAFHCAPKARFLGLEIGGKKVCFAEHAIYEFSSNMIAQVWSILDKAAIEAQI